MLGFSLNTFAQPEMTPAQSLRFVGAEALGRDGERLGVVTNFLIKPNGRLQAALIKTTALFGLMACTMAVPWEKARHGYDVKKIGFEVTKAEFNLLPPWEAKNTPGFGLARPE